MCERSHQSAPRICIGGKLESRPVRPTPPPRRGLCHKIPNIAVARSHRGFAVYLTFPSFFPSSFFLSVFRVAHLWRTDGASTLPTDVVPDSIDRHNTARFFGCSRTSLSTQPGGDMSFPGCAYGAKVFAWPSFFPPRGFVFYRIPLKAPACHCR